MVIRALLFLLLLLHVLPELTLQDAAETEQPVPLVDKEEQEDLGEGEGLFVQEAEEGCWTTAAVQLNHYLDIAEEQNALLFWTLNMKTLPSGHQSLASACLQCSSGASFQPWWHHITRDSIKEETHHSKNHPLKCMGKLCTPRWPLFAHVPPLPVPLLQSFCRSYAVTLFATLGIYFQSGGKNQQLERHKQHRLENFDYQRRMVCI